MVAAREAIMRKILGPLLVTAVAAVAACTHNDPVDDHGLAAARAQWAAHTPVAYSFVWARGCECPTEVTRPTEITVSSNQIASAVYADDRTPVAEQFRGLLRTVDGVFDDIQSAIDRHAASIDLRFDATRGYPTLVFVDYDRGIADEELSIQLSNLTAVTR
jgi:hypothetical protein